MLLHGARSFTRSSWASSIRAQSLRQLSNSPTEKVVSVAPRSSLSIKAIRQSPDLYSENCVRRHYEELSEFPSRIVSLFNQWLELQKSSRSLRQENKAIRSRLSHAKPLDGNELGLEDGDNPGKDALLERARELKTSIGLIEQNEKDLDDQIQSLATQLPNLTSPETPFGTDPRLVGYLNVDLNEDISKDLQESERDHVRLGAEFDLLNFANAGTTSGWGWYYLKNEAALLEQALIAYATSVAIKYGFSIVSPPSMTYSHIATACGFQPRDRGGEQQIYAIERNEGDGGNDKPSHVLSGTAEIPFAGMNANEIFEERDLPRKIVGSSRCYRAEAGARGAKTKGLYRVHEFTKVEMFSWTMPEDSTRIFEKMLEVQKEILDSIGLRCRVLEMPAADLGASATRKQDIEAYFPSRAKANIGQGWGEVTSASICTDYQSRRLNTRVKGSQEVNYPHTVNGTALAVPRVLAALLEYGWSAEEGSIKIPRVLWPWMHSVQEIKKR